MPQRILEKTPKKTCKKDRGTPLWLTARTGEDLNTVAGRYDGTRSMNYWLVTFLIGSITFGIAHFVWMHKTSARFGNELARRGHHPTVQAMDFWLWGVLGMLIIVGPFIFLHKWLQAANQVCADFNERG